MARTCCTATPRSGLTLHARAAQAVTPTQSDDDAAEFGYIHSMRDELFLLDDNQINLVWFVKVPASGELFSCSYARGFPDFRRGNDVKLIRRKAGYGYIVGLHDKLEGEAAEVWVINEMDIEGVLSASLRDTREIL